MPKKEKKKKATSVVEDPTEIFNTKLAALEAVSLEPGQDPEELAFEFMLGALASPLSLSLHPMSISTQSSLQLNSTAYSPRQQDAHSHSKPFSLIISRCIQYQCC